MTQLNVIAQYYHGFGFNVTHLRLKNGQYDMNLKSKVHHWDLELKSPSHSWDRFKTQRQTNDELNEYVWRKATGLGVVLGYKSLRALDIDECGDYELIQTILEILELPKDYEWVVKSGSHNGYHIIFYSDEHTYPTELGKVKAFRPNSSHKYSFKHIELRWSGHLVLAPSMHPSFNRYEFINKNYPYYKPQWIDLSLLEKVIDRICKFRSHSPYVDEQDTVHNFTYSGSYIDSYLEDPNINNYEKGNLIELDKETYDFYWQDEYFRNNHFAECLDKSDKFVDKQIVHNEPYYIFFDTETTGLATDNTAPPSNSDNWPRLVQLGYIVTDNCGYVIKKKTMIVKPLGFEIPISATNIHGISHSKACTEGENLLSVLLDFCQEVRNCDFIVAHNLNFDKGVLMSEFMRLDAYNGIHFQKLICTMESTTSFCGILNNNGMKFPKLSELHFKLFNESFSETHDAGIDVAVTTKCFWKLKEMGQI